jgi:chemotaxis protein histidine kinase CheA
MLRRFHLASLSAAALAIAGSCFAQTKVVEMERRPVFRVDVVEKITIAVNYRHRSGATMIDFRGTLLMPRASGQARVASQRGYIEIEADLKNMTPAMTFGAEYLTFVLWAITPEGRASNLGEVVVRNGRSKLKVTTELQAFGLIVTAEPYFAVRHPSDLVVLENEVRKDTKGIVEVIDAKYELLKRGQYQPLANPLMLTLDPRVPVELYQARNAVQIASSSGAGQYAQDTFLKAERSLRQAEAYQARNAGPKPVAMLAREAVQTAEDAREIAVRRQEQEQLAREREEATRREELAKAAAAEEAKRRAEAEQARRAEAERRAKAEALAENRASESARLQRELAVVRDAVSKAREEAQRAMARLQQETESFSAERARWEEELKRREADEAERRRRLTELERADLRLRLVDQISKLLPARETDAGLAFEVTDQLFEASGDELTFTGRERLALVTGILLAHPGLSFSIPNSGEAAGQAASLGKRLETVRRYLAGRGLEESPAPAASLVEKQPSAVNGSSEAGAFEVFVTGEPIAAAPFSGNSGFVVDFMEVRAVEEIGLPRGLFG